MSFHIGSLIKKEIKERGWSIKKFSQEANMTYRNALYLFERTDVSVEQLQQISKVLDFDFVGLYIVKEQPLSVVGEARPEYKKTNNMPVLTYSFGIPAEAYSNINQFQEEIKNVSERFGMTILD